MDKIIPFEKSFASSNKATYWSKKNIINPKNIRLSSGKKFWFDCDKCAHSFEKSLSSIKKNEWCPYCCINSKTLCNDKECSRCLESSFASSDKVKYWSDKNEIKPRMVFKNSNTKYWFDCDKCAHKYNTKPSDIICKNIGCPYCCKPPHKLCDNNECKSCFDNSISSNDKSKYWSDKNEIKPRMVFKNSNTKYWFDCDKCAHSFEKTIAALTNKDSWCPYCVNQMICNKDDCIMCFNMSFASNDKSKYWSEINEIKPRMVFKSTADKFDFICNCGHTFNSCLSSITAGSWCPFCCNPSLKLCNEINCKMCFDKSFASNDKSKYWSDKNEIKPRMVFKNSNTKYWFDCDKCNHLFETNLNNITQSNGWCSYCSNNNLCNETTCKICFDKSFASNYKSQYWSEKNTILPRKVFKCSNEKYLFNCNNCSHEFNISLSHITTRNSWCIYCCNSSRVLCNTYNCTFCFDKSFASNIRSQYWSKKNKLNPRDVFKSTSDKFWFKCIKGHEFLQALNNTSFGKWCPYCVNKTEQKLYDELIKYYNNLQQQFKVEWCKNKTYLPYDFVLENDKIIIELDGIQHFKQVSNWDPPEKTHINDKYKMKCANDNSFSIIRLLQSDVFYDTYNWLEELKTNIEKIKNNNIVQNIYMCKDNEYEIFQTIQISLE